MIKPRKSESEKAPAVKPSPEDIEEFGEDKKEKTANTSVVSGAKTGNIFGFAFCHHLYLFSVLQVKVKHFLEQLYKPITRSPSQPMRSLQT